MLRYFYLPSWHLDYVCHVLRSYHLSEPDYDEDDDQLMQQ